ncbi:MAG: phosphoenolpyruvate synthase, partial [Candidatus Aminicenantes bacterium]|nr:phosphoenolpyruvate synthase [Candidatus Aminicenantes bacterium]
MAIKKNLSRQTGITSFQRDASESVNHFSYMGKGELGGKAHGLAKIKNYLESFSSEHPVDEVEIGIPPLTVITTSFFDQFMEMNHLYDIVGLEMSDEKLAHHFQKAELPPLLNGDLRSLISKANTPLAIRSSCLLEDSLESPFAGVYQTKMIPNNQSDTNSRFSKLVEAIKFIYASTFFRNARNYMRS